MKDFKVQYEYYFSGARTVVVQAETKLEAIEKARAAVWDHGGNIRSGSWKVIAQKDPSKPKWKEVRS
jgi:hypothetical protein